MLSAFPIGLEAAEPPQPRTPRPCWMNVDGSLHEASGRRRLRSEYRCIPPPTSRTAEDQKQEPAMSATVQVQPPNSKALSRTRLELHRNFSIVIYPWLPPLPPHPRERHHRFQQTKFPSAITIHAHYTTCNLLLVHLFVSNEQLWLYTLIGIAITQIAIG